MCINEDNDSSEWDLGELNTVLLPIHFGLEPLTEERVAGLKKNECKQKTSRKRQ